MDKETETERGVGVSLSVDGRLRQAAGEVLGEAEGATQGRVCVPADKLGISCDK